MKTEVTLIIPTYNEANYLPVLDKSVKEQKMGNKLEKIVANSPKTNDKTAEIAESLGYTVIEGGLPARGRNAGAEVAKGEILILADCDTQFKPGFLPKALKEFKEKELDVAATIYEPLPTKSKFYDGIHKFVAKLTNNAVKKSAETDHPFMHLVMFIKKDLYQKMGGSDEDIIFGEDAELAKRAVRSYGAKMGVIECDPIRVSMRKAEKKGPIKYYLHCGWLNTVRLFGHEYRRSKSKMKYHETEKLSKANI